MNNLGFQEILVIAFILLVVVGPERLPDLMRKAGTWIARFRRETQRSVDELKRAANLEELDRELKAISRDVKDAGRNMARVASGEPSRAKDEPPPFDPEAT